MSVCPSAWNNFGHHWKIFHEISYLRIFRNSVEIFIKIWQEWQALYTKNQFTLLILSRSVFPRMKNIPGKSCRQITHFNLPNNFFENCTVYETRWKNIAEPNRLQMTIRCMHIACWIPKATNTHPEYVIAHCFSTATMASRTRPKRYVIRTLPELFVI